MSARPSIPVLAFHAIESGPGPLRIAPDVFARVVESLAESGATAITARQAGLILDGVDPCPRRPVVFTFDDGYRSVHAEALAILSAVGWAGTVFPVTSGIGRHNTWDAAEGVDLPIMSSSELLELSAEGWEIGGHTHRHPSLPTLAAEQIEEELRLADDALAALGMAVESFAYPFGHSDPASRAVAGRRYRWCWEIGTQRASAEHPSEALPRIEAWYVRRPLLARHLHDPGGAIWLAARGAARSLRSRIA